MNRRPSDQALGTLGAWLHAAGAVCALAVCLAVWLCLFRPVDAAARAARAGTAGLNRVLADADRIRNEHGQLKQQLAAARQAAARLSQSGPDQPQEAEFLAQITELADDVGLEIQDYRPMEKRRRERYSLLTVDLISAGPYASIGRFLDGLPRLPRHCTVEQLQISSKPDLGSCEARMTLRLYFGAQGRAADRGAEAAKGAT